MPTYKNIVILTGAGISAESGISTFRDKDGLWAKFNVEDVATPQAFAKNPARVHDFYNMRRSALKGVKPNPAHVALAELEAAYVNGRGTVTVVTQNVDNLHEAGGSKNLIHMHGELSRAWCRSCNSKMAWSDDITTATDCPHCQKAGAMRPDIVWFGEMPYHMDRIYDLIQGCDLFISIGTSGNVYPAAGFVQEARAAGAHTVELNLEPSEGATLFHEVVNGKASLIVPAYVRKLLA